jgi:hypothetical protein
MASVELDPCVELRTGWIPRTTASNSPGITPAGWAYCCRKSTSSAPRTPSTSDPGSAEHQQQAQQSAVPAVQARHLYRGLLGVGYRWRYDGVRQHLQLPGEEHALKFSQVRCFPSQKALCCYARGEDSVCLCVWPWSLRQSSSFLLAEVVLLACLSVHDPCVIILL